MKNNPIIDRDKQHQQPIVWQKQGRLITAQGQHPWMQSYATTPVPLLLPNNWIRVYFATRNMQNRPSVSYFDFNPDNPQTVELASQLVVKAGEVPFGLDGVYPSSVVWNDNELWMYCSCRTNQGSDFEVAIGLAVSRDNGLTFQLEKKTIMTTDATDPWIVSTPYVYRNNYQWIMYYLSGLKYDSSQHRSWYNIRKAISSDGRNWNKIDGPSVDFKDSETNLCSPSVIVWPENQNMWFSAASYPEPYKLEQATSVDGLTWIREPFLMTGDQESWDQESQCYPQVIQWKDSLLLFYSGNKNGRDGLGFAKAKI